VRWIRKAEPLRPDRKGPQSRNSPVEITTHVLEKLQENREVKQY